MTSSQVETLALRRRSVATSAARAEGLLREVLGVGAAAQALGEESTDLRDVLVVDG
jgi:hypothetical protein